MVTSAYRSKLYMEKEGWISEVVEHRQGCFHRTDLFGFGDVIAFSRDVGILLIQAYYKGAAKQHIKLWPKTNKLIREWVKAGGLFEHQVWYREKKSVDGRKPWKVKRIGLGVVIVS